MKNEKTLKKEITDLVNKFEKSEKELLKDNSNLKKIKRLKKVLS